MPFAVWLRRRTTRRIALCPPLSTALWSTALCATVLCAACAPQPSGPRERLCAGSGCSDTCRELEVERCDIRERECQDLVFQSVRCVRGSGLTKLPNTEFVPQEDFSEQRREAAEGEPDLAGEVWGSYVDDGLRALRLIAENTTLAEANAVEGEATGGIQQAGMVQIAESQGYSSWWAMRLLAHEYVHAQQEHDYRGIGNLYRRFAQSNVTSQGVQAYVEGEAELYGWLTHAFMREVNPDAWQLDEFFDLDEKGLRTRVSNSASPWTPARQWQHYAIGARHLYAVWQTGHNVAVRGVLHNLNPDFGAWASGFVPRTGPRVSRQPVCAPEQTQLVVRDSLGPSGVFALLMAATAEQAVSPVEEAWTLAVQLTEDQLQMYGPTLTPGVSQAQWLSDAAQDGMCAPAPGSSPPEDPTEAGVDGPDGAPPWLTLEAGADAARPSRDARGRDAAVRDAGARDAAASDAAVPDRDAAGVEPQLPSDAATPEPDPDDPRTRLVPGGPVWASWAFGFENAEAAQRVASLVGRFEHMHVELDSARVTLRVTEASPSGALLSKWAKQSLCSP